MTTLLTPPPIRGAQQGGSERARANLEELMRLHRDAERELQLRIALLEAENAHLREQVALFMGMA